MLKKKILLLVLTGLFMPAGRASVYINFNVTLCCYWSDLLHLRDRNVEDLSGGELQRFACAVVCIQKADMFVSFICSIFVRRKFFCWRLMFFSLSSFMFDEPSSYLDVKQRLRAAITIRSLISPDRSATNTHRKRESWTKWQWIINKLFV